MLAVRGRVELAQLCVESLDVGIDLPMSFMRVDPFSPIFPTHQGTDLLRPFPLCMPPQTPAPPAPPPCSHLPHLPHLLVCALGHGNLFVAAAKSVLEPVLH